MIFVSVQSFIQGDDIAHRISSLNWRLDGGRERKRGRGEITRFWHEWMTNGEDKKFRCKLKPQEVFFLLTGRISRHFFFFSFAFYLLLEDMLTLCINQVVRLRRLSLISGKSTLPASRHRRRSSQPFVAFDQRRKRREGEKKFSSFPFSFDFFSSMIFALRLCQCRWRVIERRSVLKSEWRENRQAER